MSRIERILVIGGRGVLGRPVVRRLVREDFRVRAMARDVSQAASLLPEEVDLVGG
ncbi:MAG: NmrA family NAD(P)-binding protein [Deltaproteobacteria bacterium]|nr:NmrA family NAD(P)-binding protein [Deltaproteobacteria bacterium]